MESILLPVHLFLVRISPPKISFKRVIQPTVITASAFESDLVHLVDGHSQLRDAQRAHQQSVFSGLAARLKTGLEFPPAGVHHQQRHVGLDRNPERSIRQA